MKRSRMFFATLGTFIVLLVIFYVITGAITKYTGYSVSPVESESDFEKCLKEQYIVLYINSADSSETLKKIELFDYLKYFDIVNCHGNNAPCVEEDVESFPIWVVNEFKLDRDISFPELIKFSGCRFS
jgi:hypothetical protein